MITHLDPALDSREPEPFADETHPMRKITREAAAGRWSNQNRDTVAARFNELSAGWTAERMGGDRYEPLADALDRGNVAGTRVLELGSGTGLGTAILGRSFDNVVAMDIAIDMLRHAPADNAPRVNADASRLPLPNDAFDVVVMVNMMLFPNEVDRVLGPGGTVVWMNTSGENTPIHLPADDVDDALPGEWVGVASRSGAGTWAVLRRA